jgi:hypothetical protein
MARGGHLGPLSCVYGYRGSIGRSGVGQDTSGDDGIEIRAACLTLLHLVFADSAPQPPDTSTQDAMAVDENEMAAPIAVTVESGAFKFDALCRRRNSANWAKPSDGRVNGCSNRSFHAAACPLGPFYTHRLKRRGVQGVSGAILGL